MNDAWSSRISRRRLLAYAAASGAVALDRAGSAHAATAGAGDAKLVSDALAVELLLVFVYRQVLALGKLSAGADQLARLFLGQEQAHVRALEAELGALGEPPPPAPSTVAQADVQLAALHGSLSLASVRTEHDCLDLLYDVESIAIGVQYKALKDLSDRRLMSTAAEIMGAEAQHSALIGGLLHPGMFDRIVPVASVRGKI